MQYTIKSRKLRREFTFRAADTGGYIWLVRSNDMGASGDQICKGGSMSGQTLMCGPSQHSLEETAKRWYRQHLAAEREHGFPGYPRVAMIQVEIVSGEGDSEGTIDRYMGTPTVSSVWNRIKKERCGGDRWCFARIDGERCDSLAELREVLK
jgi:hypothetical protein